MKLYSVYDTKAQAYVSLFCSETDGLASRLVEGAASDPGTSLYKYAEDFAVYCLGEWDVVSGLISPIVPPRHVVAVSGLAAKAALSVDADYEEFFNQHIDCGECSTPQGCYSAHKCMKGKGNGSSIGDDSSVQSGSSGDDTEEFFPSN